MSILIKRVSMDCPICDKIHEVELRKDITTTIIKDEYIDYEELYYFCENADEDENMFAPLGMEIENIQNARNSYRTKHNLLTSDEIVATRSKYGLSQVDMAKLLGWGEATISRYESKAIQDEAYDNILKSVKDSPYVAYEYWKKNKGKFDFEKRMLIRQKIILNMYAHGYEKIKRQALESEYIEYQEPSEFNGNQNLDIDKLEGIVAYIAKSVDPLYKIKLMKILWYTDVMANNTLGKSMTGLVYTHNNMGALPIGHHQIVDLPNIKVKVEEYPEYTKYRFLTNEKIDMSCLTSEELAILDKVIAKFKEFTTQEIVDYMHKERAYKETKDGEVIPFSLAKDIKL